MQAEIEIDKFGQATIDIIPENKHEAALLSLISQKPLSHAETCFSRAGASICLRFVYDNISKPRDRET